MEFWIFMLLMNLLIPVSMIGFGKIFLTKPPKDINSVYGYRTRRSSKNKDTWMFAHQYCGKLMYRWGWILLFLSIIPMLFVLKKDNDAVGTVSSIICFLQLIPLLGVILPTEKALKKTFDENGNRKTI